MFYVDKNNAKGKTIIKRKKDKNNRQSKNNEEY